MRAPRSRVPCRISGSRAGTVAKPSFSTAERIASITSSRELKIAAWGGDVRGATASPPLPAARRSCAEEAGHQRGLRKRYGARRGTDATCGSTGEPPMHQRSAASLHTRDVPPRRCSKRAVDCPASTTRQPLDHGTMDLREARSQEYSIAVRSAYITSMYLVYT